MRRYRKGCFGICSEEQPTPLFVVLKQDCYRVLLCSCYWDVEVQHQNSSLVLEFFISFSTLFYQHSHTGEKVYIFYFWFCKTSSFLYCRFIYIWVDGGGGLNWTGRADEQDNERKPKQQGEIFLRKNFVSFSYINFKNVIHTGYPECGRGWTELTDRY